jgi:biopolymer transport protein TolR
MSVEQAGITENAALAKIRGRVRREIAKAEEEEEGGGEINLVPYLDIVVNTVIFLLATTASALALANINVNSPRYEDPTVGASAAPPSEEEKQKLNLTVAISYTGFIVAGAGGVMTAADGSSPTIKCMVPLQQDRCPAFLATRTTASGDNETVWVDKYDYKALTTLMKQIREKFPAERQGILTADRLIPYKVIIDTMDTLRGSGAKCLEKDPKTGDCNKDECNPKDGCLFDQIVLSAGVQ